MHKITGVTTHILGPSVKYFLKFLIVSVSVLEVSACIFLFIFFVVTLEA